MDCKKRKTGKNSIPRPKNSFMTYRMDVQYRILADKGRINNKEVSKIAGQMWNAEPDDVKSYYRRKAELGKLDHARRYPHYKYCPKKTQYSKLKSKQNLADDDQPILQGFDINMIHSTLSEYCRSWIDLLVDDFSTNYINCPIYPSLCSNTVQEFDQQFGREGASYNFDESNLYSTTQILPISNAMPTDVDELMYRYINLDVKNEADNTSQCLLPPYYADSNFMDPWNYMMDPSLNPSYFVQTSINNPHFGLEYLV